MATVAINPPKSPVTKGSKGIAAATLPNVCKMPGPPAPFVPAPLPNIGRSGKEPQGYTTTVKVEGEYVAIRGASFGSMGDVASQGTGGGIVSNNVEGPTKFLGPGSLNVKFEGKNVQLLGDPMLNNCGPAGSPANAATMTGVLQVPVVAFGGKDLHELADKCNKETNKANGHCPAGPKKADCKGLGAAKHKCCERAIKKYNEENPKSPYESEVPFSGDPLTRVDADIESAARSAANTAYYAAKVASLPTEGVWAKAYFDNGGATFKADVLVKDGAGGFKAGYDFKFACKPVSTKGLMSKKQNKKYEVVLGHPPEIIHKDGRQC